MDLQIYHILFKGEIIDGAAIDDVKTKLAAYFRKDVSKIESLFTGKKVIIKKNVDIQTCKKIKKAFDNAGAICAIVKSHPPGKAAKKATAAKQSGVRKIDPVTSSEKQHPIPIPKKEPGIDEKHCESCGGIIKISSRLCSHCGLPSRRGVKKTAFVCFGSILAIVIIGILAAIGIPNFIENRNRATIAAIDKELKKVKDAQTLYFATYQRYTDSLAALDIYVTAPNIEIKIISANEKCYKAKGINTEARLESWISCKTTDETLITTAPDIPSDTEDSEIFEEETASTPTSSGGDPFSSDEGAFEIMFPSEPAYDTQAISTPAGMIDIHFFMVEKKEYACIVGYSDYPPELMEQADHKTLLDGAAKGAVNNINGSIEYQENISLDGYYGREIGFNIPKSFKMPRGGNGKARFYIVDNRLYQVLKIGTDVISNSKTADYLDSFKLLY